jgi:two-component system chemotaxis sensor kinase CheA
VDADTLIRPDLWEHVLHPILPAELYDPRKLNTKRNFLVNPTGRFVIGGPVGDAGLKIGRAHVYSEPGHGTRFAIRVPLTLAILPTLLVELDGDVYALPLVRVVEVLAQDPRALRASLQVDGQPMLDLREQPVPLLSLREWLGLPQRPLAQQTCVVLQAGEQRYCLAVDRVRGREEVVIKALPRTLRGLPGYAGASLVGDGRMALILDVDALLRTGLRGSSPGAGNR